MAPRPRSATPAPRRRRSAAVLAVVLGGATLAAATPAAAVPDGAAVARQVDTEQPTIPRRLTTTSPDATTTVLDWNASTDNVRVTGYDIYRSVANGVPGTRIATNHPNTTYTDTTRTPGTTVWYYLKARDAAGNTSWRNGMVPATTPGGAVDTEQPTIPRRLTTTSPDATTTVLDWNASTDNVRVTGYDIYRSVANGVPGTRIATNHPNTTYTDTTRTPGTTVWYYLKARDAAGNTSWRNGMVPATTPGGGNRVEVTALGDLADCGRPSGPQVSALLDARPGPVFFLGDLAYPNGRVEDFANCFDPVYGRHVDRSIPVVGNHEYDTNGAQPYRDYFGNRATPNGVTWYATTVGDWQVVVIDTNCWEPEVGGCQPGTAQYEWLKATLAANQSTCQVILGHHPRWSSYSRYADQRYLDPMFALALDDGVDLWLNGHVHAYERFSRRTLGNRWSAEGIRFISIGSGGTDLRSFDQIATGSNKRIDDHHGVLELSLGPSDYTWAFRSTDGRVLDRGSEGCRA